MSEINSYTLWLFERPALGLHRWVAFSTYPTKEAAQAGVQRLLGGTITKSRVRVKKGDTPPAPRR